MKIRIAPVIEFTVFKPILLLYWMVYIAYILDGLHRSYIGWPISGQHCSNVHLNIAIFLGHIGWPIALIKFVPIEVSKTLHCIGAA